MKRTDPYFEYPCGPGFVTVIPVDYSCPSGSPSMGATGAMPPPGLRRGEERLIERHMYKVSYPHHIPRYRTHTEWTPGERPSSSANVAPGPKGQEVCVFLLNKTALSVEIEDAHVNAGQIMDMILQEDQELNLPPNAREVFAIWIGSNLLELQMKSHHQPFAIRTHWAELLAKYVKPTPKQIDLDDPILTFQRNVFFDKREEARIDDMRVLEFLYQEAKLNILEGKYPCEIEDCEMLAGIQARLELGPYNAELHTAEYFRKRIQNFLPPRAYKLGWYIPGMAPKLGPEHRVLEKFKSIPSNTKVYKLLRKYLEFCWLLPYYGAAMFPGQIEQKVSGLATLWNHPDIPVLVAINKEGVHVIDPKEASVLLSLKYKEFSWDYTPSLQPHNPHHLPSLFLQFQIHGQRNFHSKMLQIFSHQACLMDKLVSSFVEEAKHKQWPEDQTDHLLDDSLYSSSPWKSSSRHILAAKLHRLSLVTFNEQGECIESSGSWTKPK